MHNNKLLFKIVVYVMLASMVLSTLLVSIGYLLS